jgi:hypothetical protein
LSGDPTPPLPPILPCDGCGAEAWGLFRDGHAYCLFCEARVLEAEIAKALATLTVLRGTVAAALSEGVHPEDVLDLVKSEVEKLAHRRQLHGEPPPETARLRDFERRWARNFEARGGKANGA